MSQSSDVKSLAAALILAALGVGIIAAPFVAGAHALWIAFSLTVGGILLAGAVAAVSPVFPGEIPPLRRGG